MDNFKVRELALEELEAKNLPVHLVTFDVETGRGFAHVHRVAKKR